MRNDTIAAIATAMSNSGIGIVRISGMDAFSIIQKIYKGKKEKDFSTMKTHTIHYGYIVDDAEIKTLKITGKYRDAIEKNKLILKLRRNDDDFE